MQGSGDFFELNQLKSLPSKLLLVFFKDFTGRKFVAINLDWLISYVFFLEVPADFLFIVMTTGQQLGRW